MRRLFRLPIRRKDLCEQDVREEIRLHLELRTEQLIAQGMARAAARAEAERRMGDTRSMRHEALARERRLSWCEQLGDLGRELQWCLRGLRRSPLFTVTALLTLTLGIGATTAIFSVVDRVLLSPLPYPDPERVVTIREHNGEGRPSNLGFATFSDLAADSSTLASIAAYRPWVPTLVGDGDPRLIRGQRVSPSFFDVLGVQPAIGRGLVAADDQSGTERVVVISDGLWRRDLHGDPDVIGRTLTLSGAAWTVVGVMPRGFVSLSDPTAEAWRPLRYDVSQAWACRACRHLSVLGRLNPEATATSAASELDAQIKDLATAFPSAYVDPGVEVVTLHRQITRAVRPALLLLMGAVVVFLLIACANLTHLLLARGGARRGELSVRVALGASRWRLVRLHVIEGLLLAFGGGVLGLGLAIIGRRIMLALAPPDVPRLHETQLDGTLLLFALAVTTAVGLTTGLLPVLGRWRVPWKGLAGAGRRVTATRRSVRATLVVAEVALTLVLLIGAGLLLRSLGKQVQEPLGFAPDRLLTQLISLSGPGFRTSEDFHTFYGRVLDEVNALPGIVAAGLTSQLPLSEDHDGYSIHFESRPSDNPEEAPGARRYAVSPGYVETMGIPLLRGRSLDERDDADHPGVALISAGFARAVLGEQNPIGERIRLGGHDDGPWYTIVGVVGDTKQDSLTADVAPAVYLPLEQWKFNDNLVSLVVRTHSDPQAQARPVRDAIRRADPDQPVTRIATMHELTLRSAALTRFLLRLFQAFGSIALVLASIGIFGVLAGTVVERRDELAVRLALGARPESIRSLVLRQAVLLTSIGIGLGLVGAVALSRLTEGLLYGVVPTDPATYAAVAILLFGVGTVAGWIPARRAAGTDPVAILRRM